MVFLAHQVVASDSALERHGINGRMCTRDIVLPQRLVRERGCPVGREGNVEAPIEGLFGIAGVRQAPELGGADVVVVACGEPAAETPCAASAEAETGA